MNGALVGQLNAQEQGDMAPTAASLSAYATACRDLSKAVATWQRLSTSELNALNATLKGRGATAIAVPAGQIKAPSCL